MTYHALRYLPDVPLSKRPHAPTLGRWDTWLDAEEARVTRPGAELLEVVVREEPGS